MAAATASDWEGSTSSVSINDVPDEILHNIFSFFTPQQLCTELAPVCSKWHRISRDPRLRRNLTLREAGLVSAVKLFLGEPLQHLTALTVHNWCGDSLESLSTLVATRCPKLEHFTYTASKSKPTLDQNSVVFPLTSGEAVKALAVGCQHITHLSLFGIVLSDTSFKIFVLFPMLRRLDVKLRFDHTVETVDFNVDLKSLTTLNLAFSSRNRSERRYKDRFLSLVNKYRSVIKGLVISRFYEFIDDVDTWEAIYRCTNLTTLSASCDLWLISLYPPNLTYLRVKGSHSRESDFINALSVRNCLTALNRLRISDSNHCYNDDVTDRVLDAIANGYSTQLKELTLGNCLPVTDVGLRRVITQCSSLERLTLKYLYNITSASLSEIPRRLPRLKELRILSCQVDDAISNLLKNYNPEVKVYINNAFVRDDDYEEGTDNEYLPEDND